MRIKNKYGLVIGDRPILVKSWNSSRYSHTRMKAQSIHDHPRHRTKEYS